MPAIIYRIIYKNLTRKKKIKNDIYYEYFFIQDEGLAEPETLGEVTGNRGNNRGSVSLGVDPGDG